MRAPQYLLLVLAGIFACGWGLSAAHRWKFPRNIFPSLLVPVGIVLFMAGCLLTVLPNFFYE